MRFEGTIFGYNKYSADNRFIGRKGTAGAGGVFRKRWKRQIDI